MNCLKINAGLRRDSFQMHVDLQLPASGVTAILGPSGSGKSSLLRLVAGLERPQYGSLRFGEQVWADASRNVFLPSRKRRVGMVFQDYALFEHMTVLQNIAYGVPGKHAQQTAQEWIERMHLAGLEQRYPQQLSGGQRQRVALARALAPQPDVVLLDEPFSAVDAHLRQQLRSELRTLIQTLEQPVLMITHDLEDVRHLADHVGVMIDGEIRRFAPLMEAFDQPHSLEVARVLGWRNFLYIRGLKHGQVSGAWGELSLSRDVPVDSYCLAIRPEHVRIATQAENGLSATVVNVTELGAVREVECRLSDGSPITLLRPWNEPLPAAGTEVGLILPEQHLRALPERCPRRPDGEAAMTQTPAGSTAPEVPVVRCNG